MPLLAIIGNAKVINSFNRQTAYDQKVPIMAVFSSKTFYDPTRILSCRRNPLLEVIHFVWPSVGLLE